MKILTIHVDFIEFEGKKKALKQAAEAPQERQWVGRIGESAGCGWEMYGTDRLCVE